MEIKIGNRLVGSRNPCFIVAEAGVNHNGSFALAKKLIDAAAKTGADAIKFQSFSAKKLVSKKAGKAKYQLRTTGNAGTQFSMLKKLELSEKEQRKLAAYAKKRGIIFLSTPYDSESVDILRSLRVPAYKISSADITNIPLLEKVSRTKKPVIMSTGMATLREISEAVSEVKKAGNSKIILLHCVSEYPAETKNANLRAIQTLKRQFRTVVGYSDHTVGKIVPLAAVSLGAGVIEKHFTLNRRMKGPDHAASIEPADFRQMVMEIREIEKSFGSGKKILTKTELQNKKVMRRGVYAAVNIKAGAKVKKEMLAFMRPESSLKPGDYVKIIGRKARKNIKAGEELKLGYFK